MIKKHKNWIMLTLTLVAVGVYYALVFVPSRREAREIRQEISQMRSFLASATSLPVLIEEANIKLAQTGRYISDWNRRAPHEKEIPRAFAEINRAARQANVVTTHFDPQPPIPMQTMSKIPLSVGITGRFDQVGLMLYQLERMNRPLWIEHFQVEGSAENGGDVECEIRIVLFASNSG